MIKKAFAFLVLLIALSSSMPVQASGNVMVSLSDEPPEDYKVWDGDVSAFAQSVDMKVPLFGRFVGGFRIIVSLFAVSAIVVVWTAIKRKKE
jgi:hypothetical protein